MRKKTIIVAMVVLFSFLITSGAQAQLPPTPPNVSILGPVEFSLYNSGMVAIFSPENSTNYINPTVLNFSVAATGLFGQFGNVGFSVDNGIIFSVTNFTNKSVTPSGETYWLLTIVLSNIELPTLSYGNHTATVFYGWQYLGNTPSYQVDAHASASFMIVNATDIVPPNISDVSIESVGRTEFQLNFTVNELPSWMGYSLDTETNVTLTGNTTLEAAPGFHTLIIYANDTAGNMGASEIIEFKSQINLPTLTPSPNLTETPSPSPTIPEFPLAAIAISFLTVTVLVGVFFRRKQLRK